MVPGGRVRRPSAAAAATTFLLLGALLCAREAAAERDDLRDDDESFPWPPALSAPEVDHNLFKVALTQKGYIQYLRYKVDVPDLYEFAYCLWLRSENFTNPQPIFSYSRRESERLARGWLAQTRHGVLVQMALRERPVMRVLTGLRERTWHHVCQGWSAVRARWTLHLDGALVASGFAPHLRGRALPGGGVLAVGQEVTDADRGLDDGIEGQVFGFNMAVGGGDAARRLARDGFARCAEGRGTPRPSAGRMRLLVAWASTPVALFGGALVEPARPVCGDF